MVNMQKLALLYVEKTKTITVPQFEINFIIDYYTLLRLRLSAEYIWYKIDFTQLNVNIMKARLDEDKDR